MPIISDDNVVQIKMKFLIWIAGIIVTSVGALGGWQQIQISDLKTNVKELEEKKLGGIETKVYVIKSEDIPQVFRVISVHQSQLNTINTILFGKPIESDIGFGNDVIIPTIPKRE